MARTDFHERLDEVPQGGPGSERAFGLVFAAVFLLIGLWPLLGAGTPAAWALAIAAGFLVLALAAPGMLAPLNRLWFRFGMLLHRLVTPVVLAIVFFVTVTPTGLLMRLFGRDLLRLRFDRDAESYWIPRQPPGPPPESLRQQF